MRVLWIVWVGPILLVALGTCAYSATRPDLLLNPTSRQIYLAHPGPNPDSGKSWYTEPIDLVPQNFTTGEPMAAAEKRLVDAGYKSYGVSEIGPSWFDPAAPIIQRHLFFIEGTSFLIACEDFLVELHGSDGQLLSASATKRHNRCGL